MKRFTAVSVALPLAALGVLLFAAAATAVATPPTRWVTTFAGGTEGASNGIGTNAHFDQPTGVAYDGRGHLYVADYMNSTIRRIVR